VREELEVCQKGCYVMEETLKSALELGKLENPNTTEKLCATATDLRALCTDCFQMTQNSALRNGITLQHRIELEPGVFHLVNGLRLMQILLNLLSNAADAYTKSDSVTLSVTYQQYDRLADSDILCFRVIHTGMAIERAQQADLFRKYRSFSARAGSGV
jgi:signal transduction histidine kinase